MSKKKIDIDKLKIERKETNRRILELRQLRSSLYYEMDHGFGANKSYSELVGEIVDINKQLNELRDRIAEIDKILNDQN